MTFRASNAVIREPQAEADLRSRTADHIRHQRITPELVSTIRQFGTLAGKEELYAQQSPEVLCSVRRSSGTKASTTWRRGGAIGPGRVLAAYREFADRVGTITTSRGAKGEMVRNTIAWLGPIFRISQIEANCPNVSDLQVARAARARG